MATQVIIRKGTAAENNAFTGANGEITIDTTTYNIRIHNGVTAGGAARTIVSSANNVGDLSMTGNISASYFLGNGACLSGISSSAIFSGLSNVRVTASGGNIAANVGSTSNVLVIADSGTFVTGVISASGNITGNYFIGNGSALTGVSGFSTAKGIIFSYVFGG